MGDCAEIRPVLAELALGALNGDERGEALRHVASCPACARQLERLAGTADGLLLLAPQAEPPTGFEAATLARMTAVPRRRSRRSVLALAAGAVAVALAGAAAGGAVVHHQGEDDRLRLRAMDLSTTGGRTAGTVFLYQGQPSWMLISIANAPANGAYRAVVTYAQGTSRDAGVCQVAGGTGTTAYPLRAPVAQVAAVTLTAPDGTTLRTV